MKAISVVCLCFALLIPAAYSQRALQTPPRASQVRTDSLKDQARRQDLQSPYGPEQVLYAF
jgi:hypothetical protein